MIYPCPFSATHLFGFISFEKGIHKDCVDICSKTIANMRLFIADMLILAWVVQFILPANFFIVENWSSPGYCSRPWTKLWTHLLSFCYEQVTIWHIHDIHILPVSLHNPTLAAKPIIAAKCGRMVLESAAN